jgi:hypothetical protein
MNVRLSRNLLHLVVGFQETNIHLKKGSILDILIFFLKYYEARIIVALSRKVLEELKGTFLLFQVCFCYISCLGELFDSSFHISETQNHRF